MNTMPLESDYIKRSQFISEKNTSNAMEPRSIKPKESILASFCKISNEHLARTCQIQPLAWGLQIKNKLLRVRPQYFLNSKLKTQK
jgi:hypothetical protein